MILLYTKLIKSNSECNQKQNIVFSDKLNYYDNGKTNMDITCPNCGSRDLVCHGYYNRNFIYEYNYKHVKKRIKIKRVKCKECHKTHALLPIDIVPYKITVFSVIIKCLFDDEYFNNSNFSFDTKIFWYKSFNKFLPFIRTMFSTCTDIYNSISTNFDKFYTEFYYKIKKIILMSRYGVYNIGLL